MSASTPRRMIGRRFGPTSEHREGRERVLGRRVIVTNAGLIEVVEAKIAARDSATRVTGYDLELEAGLHPYGIVETAAGSLVGE
jgi:hypothetical protein